jgi:ABC-type branched-subunit amino acid transport system substrate-binding protein
MTYRAISFAVAAMLCGAGSATQAEEAPYKVGWITSLSGPAAGTAGAANLAIQVAVERANAGNAAGRKIELVTGDDASDPRTAAQVCARFVIEEKVQAIIGAQPTPSRLACNQAAVKAGLPYIAASGSAGDICLPNMFYVGQVPNQFVLPLADYLLKQGFKHLYLLGADYSAPRAALRLAKADIEAHGGTVVGMSFTPQDTSDFSADLGKIAAAKPDAVLQSLTGVGIVTFHRQFANDPRVTGIKLADNFLLESMAKALGKDVAGVYVASSYYASIDTPANIAFKAAIQSKFGPQSIPDYWSVYATNALGLLAQAVKQAGPDPKAVIAALAHAHYDGVAGPISIVRNYAAEITYIGEAKGDGTIAVLEHSAEVQPELSCKR